MTTRQELQAEDRSADERWNAGEAVMLSATVRGNCGRIHQSIAEWRACAACRIDSIRTAAPCADEMLYPTNETVEKSEDE